MKPYKCPVCEGKGIVVGGFYNSIGPYSSSTSITEPCRACGGVGIIWGVEEKDSNIMPYDDVMGMWISDGTR